MVWPHSATHIAETKAHIVGLSSKEMMASRSSLERVHTIRIYDSTSFSFEGAHVGMILAMVFLP